MVGILVAHRTFGNRPKTGSSDSLSLTLNEALGDEYRRQNNDKSQ
jgi:hypothetical protein